MKPIGRFQVISGPRRSIRTRSTTSITTLRKSRGLGTAHSWNSCEWVAGGGAPSTSWSHTCLPMTPGIEPSRGRGNATSCAPATSPRLQRSRKTSHSARTRLQVRRRCFCIADFWWIVCGLYCDRHFFSSRGLRALADLACVLRFQPGNRGPTRRGRSSRGVKRRATKYG